MITEMPKYRAHVRFEQRSIEDRQASIKEGHYVAQDIDFAIITPSGGHTTVEQKITKELLAQWRNSEDNEYRARMFDMWKEGLEDPEEGTPLRSCSIFSPAQIETLTRLGIRSVENCATMPEQALQKVGMGARDMQQKAMKWLEAGRDVGQVAEKLRAFEQRIADLEAENERKDHVISELNEKRGPGRPRKTEAA